jgi:hypothetical protein
MDLFCAVKRAEIKDEENCQNNLVDAFFQKRKLSAETRKTRFSAEKNPRRLIIGLEWKS